MRRHSLMSFVRKKLQYAEHHGSRFVRREAELAEEIINEPTGFHEFARAGEFKKPLIDAPAQLKKRRVKKFFLLIPGGGLASINPRRKF